MMLSFNVFKSFYYLLTHCYCVYMIITNYNFMFPLFKIIGYHLSNVRKLFMLTLILVFTRLSFIKLQGVLFFVYIVF